ncbi:MAG: HD domain-containing protein [Flavobacteriales bacterium]
MEKITQDLLQKTIQFVQKELQGNESGHDWFHIERVWKLSKTISKQESVNLMVVELGALLHDITDSKFHDGNEEIGPRKAEEFLLSAHVSREIIDQVIFIIKNISFKGGGYNPNTSPELKVVQDADRLDAIGAIGIARTFNYGGFKNNEIYNPNRPPNLNKTVEEYKKGNDTTINHFYEKLLLLKDKMNTPTGLMMAEKRHAFMQQYLNQFYGEWNGDL